MYIFVKKSLKKTIFFRNPTQIPHCMDLTLPRQLHPDSSAELQDVHILLVIGVNGSGKTSFGNDLASRYPQLAERISGMHALFINTPANSLDDLMDRRMPRPLFSEYEKLVMRLQQEEFEAAVEYKELSKNGQGIPPPVTKIDRIQTIWEKMFPRNRLVRKSGFIELASTSKQGSSYTAERMSDGEKIVFYLIGAVLSAREGALLIIEEPEIYLHASIKGWLWDEIESARPDCTFVYLTHDIEFASSRRNSRRIWIRSYDADDKVWDYEQVESNDSLPEELYMEILGNRKPVLFIEGTDSSSIDIRLYPYIFPEYLVKPMGGCQKVIETTKAFGQLKDFHTLESRGIVDRDRRTEGEIAYLRNQHVYVPDVAEVENLLMTEDVIKTVARRMLQQPGNVFDEVKENVIRLFEKDLDAQALLHAKHRVRKKLEIAINRKIATVEELAAHVDGIRDNIHVQALYDELHAEFSSYIRNRRYPDILRVYNQKGMLPQSRVCTLCGISNKECYLNLVLSILKENKDDAHIIRTAIKRSLGFDEEKEA